MDEPTERFVDHDGETLCVRDRPGTSPAIVALHGFPDDSRIYDRLIPALAPRRVVTFDWLGYGRSSRRASEEFTPTGRQREIRGVLDALDLDRVVLLGHDASGPEAIDFTNTHPDRIAHLVLTNTYYGRSPHLRLPEMIALMADPALAPLTDAMLEDPDQRAWLLTYTGRRFGIIADTFSPDGIAVTSIIPQFFGDTRQPDALAEIRAWTADLPSALTHQDTTIASGAFQNTQLPVSVIFGRDDPHLNPHVAQHLSGLFANADLHLLDHASHWPQWDRPDVVADLINRSITGTAAIWG